MSKEAAKAYYTKQLGDPDSGYITPQDAMDSLDVVYADLTLADKAVTAAKIADNTITAAQIAANAVGASELADNAVDTAAIADSAVTAAKIADGAATPAKLATTGRFVFPTGAANGYGFASGAVHLSGTGAPEGAVTAPPGSTWLQTDSTTDVKGWIRWIKATGTGNTGWVAGPEADTGWRDVSAALESGATGSLKVRRIGCNVTFASFSLTSTTNGMWTVPSGFRPMDSGYDRSFPVAQNNGTAGAVGYGPAGINKIDMSAGMKAYGEVWLVWQWDSSDAWPSSLPGSAA